MARPRLLLPRKNHIEKNLHYEVDFTRLWSDEAGQRRDVRYPSVRVASHSLY